MPAPIAFVAMVIFCTLPVVLLAIALVHALAAVVGTVARERRATATRLPRLTVLP